MTKSTHRFHRWMKCVSRVPISEFGDPDHRSGYAYDEKNGTGLDQRPALAVDKGRGRPGYLFLRFSRRKGCDSAPTVPGGTADEAKADGMGATTPRRLGALEHELAVLERRADDVEHAAERFDQWESCLSWVPVTEYGDPDRRYGYRFGGEDTGLGYRPALAIDISPWDDPDYEFLAFIGRDRPFTHRECGHEPGEGTDRPEIRPAPDARSKLRASSPRSERQRDLEQEIHSFREDVEDLAEPIEEFALFDQCMFTIGVSAYGIDRGDVGYVFGHHRRSALAMDMRGFDKPQYDLLAFPGEEPPQIECNEDASGQGTDE